MSTENPSSEDHFNINWVKAALALKYTRDGLAPFADRVAKQEHQTIVNHYRSACQGCTTKNLLPLHERRECPSENKDRCFCRDRRARRPCPNNFCSELYEQILRDHIDLDPAWFNTDPSKWYNDYWEYTLCFIPTREERGVHSAEESDISSILSICINNIRFHSHISSFISFVKCRQICCEILYSTSMQLTDEVLDNYVEDMFSVLQDTKALINDPDAQQAVSKIKQLQKGEMVISHQDENEVITAALKEIGKIKKALSNQIQAKVLKLLRKPAGEKCRVETTAESRGSETTATLLEDICKRLIKQARLMIGSQFDLTNTWNKIRIRLLRKITQSDLGSDNGISGGSQTDESECNILETRKLFNRLFEEKLSQTIIEDAQYITSAMSSEPQNKEYTALNDIKNEDTARRDLEMKKRLADPIRAECLCVNDLLTGEKLNNLCSREGKSSLNVKKECQNICAFIKEMSAEIVHVWPAYTLQDETAVTFVVFTKKKIPLETYWALEIRLLGQYDDESEHIMNSEENRPLQAAMANTISSIIDQHSRDLMRKHKFLSAITACSVKYETCGTDGKKIVAKPCIVLTVLVKHFIPLEEERFAETLGNIPVDVREGGVRFCGTSADEKLDTLQMGCKISSNYAKEICGTLGGFIEHPEYGLCGFTCAHIVLSTAKIKARLIEKGQLDVVDEESLRFLLETNEEHMAPFEIFQPSSEKENKIGRLVKLVFKEGSETDTGVDVAMFKIEQRAPVAGTFPHIDGNPTALTYESGKVWGKYGIPPDERNVTKFGCVTGLTTGTIQFENSSVKEISFDHIQRNTGPSTATLHKQYQIKSDEMHNTFSYFGDSGALVFMKDITGDMRCIGMVAGGCSDNTIAVTPITAILKELGVNSLTFFKTGITLDDLYKSIKQMDKNNNIRIKAIANSHRRHIKEIDARMNETKDELHKKMDRLLKDAPPNT